VLIGDGEGRNTGQTERRDSCREWLYLQLWYFSSFFLLPSCLPVLLSSCLVFFLFYLFISVLRVWKLKSHFNKIATVKLVLLLGQIHVIYERVVVCLGTLVTHLIWFKPSAIEFSYIWHVFDQVRTNCWFDTHFLLLTVRTNCIIRCCMEPPSLIKIASSADWNCFINKMH
jgi:hypothetical protein